MIRRFIDKFFAKRTSTPQPINYNQAYFMQSLQGMLNNFITGGATGPLSVSEARAYQFSAIWCATRLLSEAMKQLPFYLLEENTDNGDLTRVLDNPISRTLKRPNPFMDGKTFIEFMTIQMINGGNGYAEIVRNSRGELAELYPIHPSRVTVKKDPGSQAIYYQVTNDDQTAVRLEWNEMFRLSGAIPDQLGFGKPVIYAAGSTINTALSADKYEEELYNNSAVPKGVIKLATRPSEEEMQNLRQSWNSVHKGASNSSNVAIIDATMDYQAIGFSNADTQYIESRQFTITEIARWYNIPPNKLHEHSRSTFNNIEQLSIEYVQDSIVPWVDRWEAAIRYHFLQDSELIPEFKVEGLLRGDTESRYAGYNLLLEKGVLSINEVRHLEGWNSIDGGDEHRIQLSYAPLETADEIAGATEEEEGEPAIQEEEDDIPEVLKKIELTASENVRRLQYKEEQSVKKVKTSTELLNLYDKSQKLLANAIEHSSDASKLLGGKDILADELARLEQRFADYAREIENE